MMGYKNNDIIEYLIKKSDNQVIHFTNKFDNIKSIVSDKKLNLRYCKEEFWFEDNVISINAHPMVCFSEQNTTNLKDKSITYGKYGISFRPKWIIEKNIHPVLYIEKDSLVAKSISQLLQERRKMDKGNPLRLPIMTLKAYIKNTIGYNVYLKKKDFVFKDENEWRFVPTIKQISNNYISLNRSSYIKNEFVYNNRLIDFPLKFNEEDILNIYLENENEKEELLKKCKIDSSIIKISNWK